MDRMGSSSRRGSTNQKKHIRLAALILFSAVAIYATFISVNYTAFDDVNALYVATNGNDSTGTGAIDKPFKTLKRAVAYIDSANLNNGVRVFVRAGEYDQSETLQITRGHSGTASAPTMIANFPGEQATIRGSYKATNVTQVSGNVYKTALTGTPAANANFRFIYFNGTRILPARYPDHKPLNYSLPDPYQGTRAFTATDQPAVKNIVKYRAEDAGAINALVGKTGLYLEIDSNEGIWYWHERAGITSINTSTREITLDRSLPYTINPGNEYWVEGAESLLSPGEYYLNPSTKLLTVHLPSAYKTTDRLGIPIVDSLVTSQANHLTWHGFKMEEFNGAGFVVQGNSTNNTFRNNEVRNGKIAFTTAYDRNPNILVDGNHIYEMEQGISVLGGMYMKNLENSGNVISNNYIHHTDLVEGRGNHAVLIDKEMSRVLVINNTITDTSRHGITVEGPMHTIKNNYVARAGQLRMDVGGIHTGSRNLLNQGTLLEGNFVENIGTRFPKSYGVWELVDHRTANANPPAPSFSRMSDDWNSGETERKNIYIQKYGPCISNHGGGYNTFENNYLTCGNTGFFFGGIRVGDAFFDPFYAQAYQKIQNMGAEGYNTNLYYQTFPHLRDYPAPANLQNGDIMRNNKIINNVFEGYRAYKLHLGVPSRYEFKGNIVRDNCNDQFKALYEPITTPGSYSDLTKTQWQALGLDLDLRELSCSQPLFKPGTYEIDPTSPAAGSGFQTLNPKAAGVKNVLAKAPTIALPGQTVIAATAAVAIETKAEKYGYQVAEAQYQIKLDGGASIGNWTKLNATYEVVNTSHLQEGKKYSFCVRQRNDALNLTNAAPDSLWVNGNCTTPLVAKPTTPGPAPVGSGGGNATPNTTGSNTAGSTPTTSPTATTALQTEDKKPDNAFSNFELLNNVVDRIGTKSTAYGVILLVWVIFFGFSYLAVHWWHRVEEKSRGK